MKVLLINPPRYYWPFIHEGDNYMLPQALPCLAAVLRENGIEVKPIDCLPLKIGWKSLRKLVEKESPDVVGVCTSETLFSHEAAKTCEMVKGIDPKIVTVVGGHHFSSFVESLRNNPIDFIVIGEGEYTLLELVQKLEESNPNFKKIKGIAFKDKNRVVVTEPRPLIENLDELPIPAYDLMPMDKYGNAYLLFSPGGTTLHHSRGCIDTCNFCACWVHMANRELKDRQIAYDPRWRTKSVERTIEEVELLYKKYKKRYLVFTDDTWNVNQEWNERFADALIERNLDLNWFAFMRADFIVRDEKAGIFKKIVDSGLVHICIGVERAIDSELKLLRKRYTSDATKKCFQILRKKYPEVFREGTFIVGLRNETKDSMLEQLRYAKEIDADYPAFHPITPVPGTALWEEAKRNGWIEIDDFKCYDWMTPIMSSEHLSRVEIEEMILELNRKFLTPTRLLKGFFSKEKNKRNMYLWFLLVALKVILHEIKEKLNFSKEETNEKLSFFTRMVKPKWYDS